jgi:two-component system OmpR family response regulator
MRLLLVEDHASLAEAFDHGLTRAGFAVDCAGSVREGRDFFERAEYDLALLDLGLPDGSGLDLLEEWRSASGMPVIVLTARGALGDRVDGLNCGADDYLVKPIEIPELVARCRAVLRRPGSRLSLILKAGNLDLDTVHRQARVRAQILPLGRREVGALEILMRRKNHVVSRRAIEETLYDEDAEITPNAIDAAVSRLRRALEAADADVTMKTVRGIGWMLFDESEK